MGCAGATALRARLLDRLEAPVLWPASSDQPPQLTSTSRLADSISHDAEFMQIAALYAGHADFDLPQLVAELVSPESVPCFAGATRRHRSERVPSGKTPGINPQRLEDAGQESPATFPFRPSTKARTSWLPISGACAEAWTSPRSGGSVAPVANAARTESGCLLGRLEPPAAGHSPGRVLHGHEGRRLGARASSAPAGQPTGVGAMAGAVAQRVGPVFGERMGDYYRGFVTEEAHALGFTLDDLRAWKPTVTAAKRGRKEKEVA